MARHTYEQAQADHKYLWSFGAAYDMTGGYVESDDLDLMLESPSKTTARYCYISQIEYWFSRGPGESCDSEQAKSELKHLLETDEKVREIRARYLGSSQEDDEDE